MKIKHVLLAIAAALLCGLVFTACGDMNNSTTDLKDTSYNFLDVNSINSLKNFPGKGWICLGAKNEYRYLDDGTLSVRAFQFFYFDDEQKILKKTNLSFDIMDLSSQNLTFNDMITNPDLNYYKTWCFIDEAFFNLHTDKLNNLY